MLRFAKASFAVSLLTGDIGGDRRIESQDSCFGVGADLVVKISSDSIHSI